MRFFFVHECSAFEAYAVKMLILNGLLKCGSRRGRPVGMRILLPTFRMRLPDGHSPQSVCPESRAACLFPGHPSPVPTRQQKARTCVRVRAHRAESLPAEGQRVCRSSFRASLRSLSSCRVSFFISLCSSRLVKLPWASKWRINPFERWKRYPLSVFAILWMRSLG